MSAPMAPPPYTAVVDQQPQQQMGWAVQQPGMQQQQPLQPPMPMHQQPIPMQQGILNRPVLNLKSA